MTSRNSSWLADVLLLLEHLFRNWVAFTPLMWSKLKPMLDIFLTRHWQELVLGVLTILLTSHRDGLHILLRQALVHLAHTATNFNTIAIQYSCLPTWLFDEACRLGFWAVIDDGGGPWLNARGAIRVPMEVNLYIVVRTVVISNGRCTGFLKDLHTVCLRWQRVVFNSTKHRVFTFLVVTGEIRVKVGASLAWRGRVWRSCFLAEAWWEQVSERDVRPTMALTAT